MDKNNNKSQSKFANQSSKINKQDSKSIIASDKSLPKDSNDKMTIEQEKEYKNRISQLQKDLKKEREKDITKQNDPNLIIKLKNEINSINKEIKKNAIISSKQRDELEKLSQEIDDKLNKMNYKKGIKNFQKENKKINEMKLKKNKLEDRIADKDKQLKNIMTLIEILKKEKDELKIKIENAKNTEQKYKLIDGQKEQEKQLIILKNDIKEKKIELKEHLKCLAIKNDLLKKISLIKDEISINHEKLTDLQKKYVELENKYKEEQNSKQTNEKKFKTKWQKYIVPKPKPKPSNSINKEIKVPQKIQQKIQKEYSEKELNAIFLALDKNKNKYEALIRRLILQNSYPDTLEKKFQSDINQQTNKINELDKQIENMNKEKEENITNLQLVKKQIDEAQKEKKNYKIKINQTIEEISKKNRINLRKDKEIKLLGEQLARFKKYLKNGNLKIIQNEPDIKIMGDDDSIDIYEQNDEEKELTEKTGFDENKDNNINNVKLNKNKNSFETGNEIDNLEYDEGENNEENYEENDED